MKIEIEVPDDLGQKILELAPKQRLMATVFLSILQQYFSQQEVLQSFRLPNFYSFSASERLVLLELIYLWFVPVQKPIELLIKEMSEEAAKNGLTPEILNDILDGN